MMRAIKLGAPVSKSLARRWAERLWYRPGRFSEPAQEKPWREKAQPIEVDFHGRPLAVYAWGPEKAPVVLLVHGWTGRGMQLGAFAQPLVEAGFRVVTFDVPAHGRSPGKQTDMMEFSESISTVTAVCGAPHAVVAHSFGAMALLYTVTKGLDVGCIVALAPPADMRNIADRFCQILNLPSSVQAQLYAGFEERFGADCWTQFSPVKIAPTLKQQGLVFHDDNDGDVPWEEGEAVAKAWSDAKFVKTSGLGHRRLMRDPDVIARSVAFIAACNSKR